MAIGPNPTGKKNPEYYAIGRGCLLFAPIDATTGAPGAYRELGNAPDFATTLTTEELEHFSSCSGVSTKDRSITISIDLSLSFTLEEINDENLSDLLLGTMSTYVNPAIAGFADATQIANADIVKQRWYNIIDGSGNRAYGITATNDIVLEDGAGTPSVTLVEGTDFTVDSAAGMFYLEDTATVDALIATSEDLVCTLTADPSATPVSEIATLTRTKVEGALKFVRLDAAGDGDKQEWEFHKVKLAANGDASLISENTLIALPFTGEAQSNDTYSPNSPTLTIRTPTNQ
jgi:hypothetical protein